MAKQVKAHALFGNKVPMGRVSEVTIPNPERTAYKVTTDGCDYVFQEWPSRGAMLTSIRMQASRAGRSGDWRAWQVCRDAPRGTTCTHAGYGPRDAH